MDTHSDAFGRLSIANGIAPLLLRLALGVTLLSAVADRLDFGDRPAQPPYRGEIGLTSLPTPLR
jgi:hypothetical protein